MAKQLDEDMSLSEVLDGFKSFVDESLDNLKESLGKLRSALDEEKGNN